MTVKGPLQYKLTIDTLSPLHIGSGQTLHKGFDYVTHLGGTWVVDNDVLADEILRGGEESVAWQDLLRGLPADDLLRESDFQDDSPLFRYILRGEPRADSKGAQLQACIKDPWDRPYLPGSSLKGAIRTAILYAMFSEQERTFSAKDVGNRAKFAAQDIERELLTTAQRRGEAPNRDIMRTLQVSDSQPLDHEHMWLYPVNVFSKGETQSPIELECVAPKVSFSATLTLDTGLLDKADHPDLRWDKDQHVKYVKNVRAVSNFFSKQRIKRQALYWENRSNALAKYYRQLQRMIDRIEKDTFLLQVGWGGGWDSKTLGEHITSQEREFAAVMQQHGRQMNKQNAWKPGREYPASRRVVVDQQGRPKLPLGWVVIKMERIR